MDILFSRLGVLFPIEFKENLTVVFGVLPDPLFLSICYVTLKLSSPFSLIVSHFHKYFSIFYWHQVAFILLFTSQFTVLINYLCALDTTLRIMNTWYKLHVMWLYGFYILKRDSIHRRQRTTVFEHCWSLYPLSHHGWINIG